jgi:enoyl-CoA hydratase/carnithine racemase
MSPELVKYERSGKVVQLVLNRPDKMNAINDALVIALKESLARFDRDDDAYVAVLRGEGRAFSTGGDVKENQLRSPEEMRRLGGPQARSIGTVDVLYDSVNWKPVIAACHGYVFGAALGWVLGCDLSVVESDTKFQVTEVQRGGSGLRLWGLMAHHGDRSFADRVALTGEVFDGAAAAEHGIVHEAVAGDSYLTRALELAEQVAACAPLSVRLQVRAMRLQSAAVDHRLVEFSEPYQLHLTEDYQRGARSFIEGKKPDFTGR